MIEYILELWNPIIQKYTRCGTWQDLERAQIMFNKPYNVRHTRRLIKRETTNLYQEKAGKYLKD